MATITIDDHELQVTLTRGERVAALRGDFSVPLEAIRSVTVEPDALAAVRGIRAPGLSLPGHVKIGTWRRGRRRIFVAVRRGVPALRLDVDGGPVEGLLVSARDATSLAERVRARAAGLRG